MSAKRQCQNCACCAERWRLTAEITALREEKERLEGWFAELGRTLQTGGMNDPAFIVGAVQACVALTDERGQELGNG